MHRKLTRGNISIVGSTVAKWIRIYSISLINIRYARTASQTDGKINAAHYKEKFVWNSTEVIMLLLRTTAPKLQSYEGRQENK